MRTPLAAMSLILLAGGCASPPGGVPSLLPRAIESRSDAEPVAAPAPVAAPDPALDAKIAGLVKDRVDAVAQFDADDRRLASQLAAARRAPVGSDAWLDAQTALASLEAGRSSVLGVLSDLEALSVARAAAGEPPYSALDTARADTEAALDRINATLDQRKAGLSL